MPDSSATCTPAAPADTASTTASRPSQPGSTPEVVVLGSAGGPTPKAGRRPVSHAVVLDGEVTLMDCGNGVAGQYTAAGLDLSQLRTILISHHHMDHVADVATLIHLAWSQLERPVRVIGPPPLRRLFELHYEAFGFDIRSRMADDDRPHLRELVEVTEIETSTSIEHGSARITAALVEHPPVRHAFGYRVEQGQMSICFSGDTRPTNAVARLARAADLLIHETTYLANAAESLPPARAAKVLGRMRSVHSDPAGAARVAESAGARALLLSPVGTFGQVADEEILKEARTSFSGPTWVGRDLLRVPLPVRGDL